MILDNDSKDREDWLWRQGSVFDTWFTTTPLKRIAKYEKFGFFGVGGRYILETIHQFNITINKLNVSL